MTVDRSMFVVQVLRYSLNTCLVHVSYSPHENALVLNFQVLHRFAFSFKLQLLLQNQLACLS